MRTRDRAAGLDFSEVLAEETETEMKEAAAISMGTDISESDILNILALCEQARRHAACAPPPWSLLRSLCAGGPGSRRHYACTLGVG